MDDASTSHVKVSNRLLFEKFEVQFESFLDLVVSGNFISCKIFLSSFIKFVSLSLHSLKLYVGALIYWFANRDLYDVAFSMVIA